MMKNLHNAAFRPMKPDAQQKQRMLSAIRSAAQSQSPREGRPVGRILGLRMAAACLLLAAALVLGSAFRGSPTAFALSVGVPDGSSVTLIDPEDGESRPSISYVDSGPELRFSITGEDIAKVEIACEQESVKAKDWTKTLDERYWNPELFYEEIQIDGATYQYVPAQSGYAPHLEITFPEGFAQYDQVWYTWHGWNLRAWASEDHYAHIQGYDANAEKRLENATEEEKLAIACGGGSTSAAGHILLEGYPEEKLTDHLTITITDRQGHTVTRTMTIQVRNNSLGQTVVTANVES